MTAKHPFFQRLYGLYICFARFSGILGFLTKILTKIDIILADFGQKWPKFGPKLLRVASKTQNWGPQPIFRQNTCLKVFLGFRGAFSTIFRRKTGPGTHFMTIFRRNTGNFGDFSRIPPIFAHFALKRGSKRANFDQKMAIKSVKSFKFGSKDSQNVRKHILYAYKHYPNPPNPLW